MIIINGEDWELPQIGKSPKIGYEYSYLTKTVMSGRVFRSYQGRRFTAKISYAFLSNEQVQKLLTYTQQSVPVKIQTPFDIFEGYAWLTITEMPQKFNDTWTAWEIQIDGADLVRA